MTQLSPLIFQRNFSPKSILLGHIGVLCRKRRPAKNHEDSRHYHWEPWAIAEVSKKRSCEYFFVNAHNCEKKLASCIVMGLKCKFLILISKFWLLIQRTVKLQT